MTTTMARMMMTMTMTTELVMVRARNVGTSDDDDADDAKSETNCWESERSLVDKTFLYIRVYIYKVLG